MKMLSITFLALIVIATTATARYTCVPKIGKYWRSASGNNIVTIKWRCKGSGNGYSVRINEICAITDNNETECGRGYRSLSIKGGTTKIDFGRTKYPIKRIFIKD